MNIEKTTNNDSGRLGEDRKKKRCRRCGTCCEKGGPALHTDDRILVEEGRIQVKYLFTIRKGEPVVDNVKGNPVFAQTDIIKIRCQTGWTGCVFFNASNKGCSIYDDRPVECRALKCWDTAALKAIYSKNRLTRRDLLSKVAGMWDLIQEHEARCSYRKVRALVASIRTGKDAQAIADLEYVVNYDQQVRLLVLSEAAANSDLILFLFGCPLKDTIRRFGPVHGL
ncbi:MAG: YkgJ family cysteine cluster protein [Deltaproteobacteria bacterium]|nr:YkgJ family cysteine cluster protein [Deltaproteobacteria bacterium]